MNGDQLDHAGFLWGQGWDSYDIACELHVGEHVIYRNIEAIIRHARAKARAAASKQAGRVIMRMPEGTEKRK